MDSIFELVLCLYAVLHSFMVCGDVRNSDFAKIGELKFYVDKTWIIREVFNDTDNYHVKVITAPPRFGKTTLMDSINKFFSLQVDVPISLDVKYWKDNSNYNVFCRKPLDICKTDLQFFKRNFGLYPVIHIDFSKLREVSDHKSLRRKLQTIISETFVEHIYLTENDTLFQNETSRARFIELCDCYSKLRLNATEMKDAFNWLSQLVHSHFNKKIILLMDDYDSIFNAILFHNITQTDTYEIIEYISDLYTNILFRNEYISKALVAGVIRTTALKTFINGPVKVYNFLEDHMFSKCFGATEQEVEELIEKHTPMGIRKKTKDFLNDYYNGYLIKSLNVRMYNILSFSVFITNRVAKKPYWIRGQRMRNLIPIDNTTARMVVSLFPKLLSSPCIYGDISIPLSIEVINTIKYFKNCSHYATNAFHHWFVSYLYSSGYLTTTNRFKPKETIFNSTLEPLVIPNVEVKLEFIKFYSSTSWMLYKIYNNSIANGINTAINMYRPEAGYQEGCDHFFMGVLKMFQTSRPQTKKDYKNIILYMLSKKFTLGERLLADLRNVFIDNGSFYQEIPSSLRKDEIQELFEQRISNNVSRTNYLVGALDVFCVNNNNVGIFLESKFLHAYDDTTLEELAKDGLLQIILSYGKFLNDNSTTIDPRMRNTKGKIFVGLSFDKITGRISMAFFNPVSGKEPIYMTSS